MKDHGLPKLALVPADLSDPHQHFGTYRGESVWTVPTGFFEKRLREKKWQWFGLFNEAYAIGGAIVDAGYAGKSFVWLFDRKSKKLIMDETTTVPASLVRVANSPASDGEVARLSVGKGRWRIQRQGKRWSIAGKMADLDFDLVLEEELSPFTAVCPNGKLFNITRKNVSLTGRGRISSDKLGEIVISDGLGFLDHSHGLMERVTQWKWAIGAGVQPDGGRIGFNLIQGFNNDLENVFWIDGKVLALPSVRFDCGSEAWRVFDDAGLVDIRLEREGERSEDLNLGLVSSKYSQPLGTWSGEIAGVEFEGLVGVGEDHLAKW